MRQQFRFTGNETVRLSHAKQQFLSELAVSSFETGNETFTESQVSSPLLGGETETQCGGDF